MLITKKSSKWVRGTQQGLLGVPFLTSKGAGPGKTEPCDTYKSNYDEFESEKQQALFVVGEKQASEKCWIEIPSVPPTA